MEENNKKVPKLRFPGYTEAWEQRKLGELLNYEQPKEYIVECTDYNDNFSTPVLTAGQTFILGYTKEEIGIKKASKKKPVIIFDDFTTSCHFVDFSFKVKSSAIKLLSSEHDETNLYFIYYVLKNIKYIPVTHERHWISIFSDFKVFIPTLSEQKQIGEFFSQLDNLITLHQRKLENLKIKKKGLLQKIFPKDGEVFPELRFPNFTDAWEQRKLGEIGEIYTGNTPSTSILDYWSDNKNEYVWVTPTDINQLTVLNSERYLSKKGWIIARKVPKNSVLITSIASIGKNAINMVPVAFNQQINAIVPIENDAYFILSSMIHNNERFSSLAGHTATPIINKSTFEKFSIMLPTLEEQKQIGEFFSQLDNLITLHQRKLNHCNVS